MLILVFDILHLIDRTQVFVIDLPERNSWLNKINLIVLQTNGFNSSAVAVNDDLWGALDEVRLTKMKFYEKKKRIIFY